MIYPIEKILEDIKEGKPVIIVDDENRENEGDIIVAANKINANLINFMATHARGLICLTLVKEHCKKLNLPLMVQSDINNHNTKFTISIDAVSGVTTGISAKDRANTILAAVNINAKPSDLVQPGHIFPLMAQPGGVLTRPGHTEAGCDLARLAGFIPAAVIVEILNTDGSMARRNDLEKFSKQHNIKLGSIEDLISYRIENEKTIERLNSRTFRTAYGEFQLFSYLDKIRNEAHLAVVKGNIEPNKTTLVRVHMEDTFTDVLKEESEQLSVEKFFSIVKKEETGIFVLLRKQTTKSLLEKAVNKNMYTHIAKDDYKTYGVGAQIISDIGAKKIKILGSKRPLSAIKGFGLELVGYLENENN